MGIRGVEELMGGLDHKENVVTRAALVREVMMVVLDRMDLPDFLDLKELLVALEQLEVLAQMALMDSLVPKVSLDLLALQDHQVFLDFLVQQVPPARKEIPGKQERLEMMAELDHQALRAQLDLKDGRDRREIRVQLESLAGLEALVCQVQEDSVVHRVFRVLQVH